MPTCPECGSEVTREDLIKEWDATPRNRESRIRVTIHYWQCPNPDCKRKFRTATRTWPEDRKADPSTPAVLRVRKKLDLNKEL